jgi:hypothetical protein
MAESKVARVVARVLIVIASVMIALPVAADDLTAAPMQLALQIPQLAPGERCVRTDHPDPSSLQPVSLHRTFHDDFDVHPLQSGKWVTHYTGPIVMPESFYAGGQASRPERKSEYNGEQEIYVDPSYEGRGLVPLGLDPFYVRDGVLSIVASRTPPALKQVLYNSEYVSGILTTQESFSQKCQSASKFDP